MSPQSLRRPARRFSAAVLLLATTSLAGCAQMGWDLNSSKPRAGDTPYYSTASIPSRATVQTGVAAWDGDVSAPGRTAAHPTLTPGSWARVTNARTAQSVVVQVTRRLDNTRDRDIELSRDAAVAVGALHEGYATVLIEPIDPRQASAEERLATRPSTPIRNETLAYDRTPRAQSGYNPNLATASVPKNAALETRGATASAGPAVTGGPRYLQLGSFRDIGNAHRALAGVQSGGLTNGAYGDGFIQTAYVDGSVFHRVRLGPIENPDLAQRALEDARKLGHTGARILKP